MKKLVAILVLCLVLALCLEGSIGAAHSGKTYPVMHPDQETLEKWIEDYNAAPLTQAEIKSWEAASLGGSKDLLGHLEYTPGERDQGVCGNCWVWVSTGIMEIALHVQEGIKDRLSIQYVNSNYNDGSGYGWACCGGDLAALVNFYDDVGIAIPWSNIDASWQDGSRTCEDDSSSVPADTISTTPSYSISNIDDAAIRTQTVEQARAIANIKSMLDQNKAAWFAFLLPNSSAWEDFFAFWDSGAESDVYDMDQFCGIFYNPIEGAGHAVLCVGYNDEDPSNSYWVMLNSWGTTPGRPNGLFRINMDMAYDGINLPYPSFYWQTLDVSFVPTSIVTPTVSTTAAAFVEETTATVNGVINNDGGEACRYRFGYSSAPGGPYTYVDWSIDTKTSGRSFSKTVSGLAKGTKYYFIAQAENSAGIDSGSELSFLTKPDAPNSFVAGTNGTGQINLLWVKGEGAQKTKIQRKEGGYPTYKDDGTQVYFGEGTSISDTGLTPGTTYYYRAWSYVQGSEQWSDSYAQTLGTTGTGLNNPPHLPSNPSPVNHAAGVSVNTDLSWTAGDPDAGDTVRYDVYFGTSSTPPLVSDNRSGTTYDPGTLADNTKYYWKITATDNYGASTVGPVWEFTTGASCRDEPSPELGFASLIAQGKLVIAYNFDPFTTVPTAMNGWTWFDPALPPAQNNLAKLSKYTAYWVKVTEECWLTYGTKTYHLAAGWNNPAWLGC